jgi:hypothetical protein
MQSAAESAQRGAPVAMTRRIVLRVLCATPLLYTRVVRGQRPSAMPVIGFLKQRVGRYIHVQRDVVHRGPAAGRLRSWSERNHRVPLGG